MNEIKVAGATLNQTPIHWANNVANIQEAISQARLAGVNVLCLPELCITGYGCEDLFYTPWVQQKALEILFDLLPATKGMVVAIGLPLSVEGRLYNVVAVAKDGAIQGFVPKRYLANDGVHYEHRWFVPGAKGDAREVVVFGQKFPFGDLIFNVAAGFTLGFEICEDAWKGKERPAHGLCQRGANIIFNPSASPFSFGKSILREALLTDVTSQHACVYVYANLLGNESGRLIFDGEVMVSGQGNIWAKNNRFSMQPINLVSLSVRQDEEGMLLTEALELPKPIQKNEEFLLAATLGLWDYLRKSASKGYVLSLSGGADSSCCAVLVAEMAKRAFTTLGEKAFQSFTKSDSISLTELQKQLLVCAYQSTKNSSLDTYTSAEVLAQELGATFYHWSVDDSVSMYTQLAENALGRPLEWSTDDIALQNIQARTRAPIIWMLANIKQALLITTSNRSEGDVGYATMDGDTAGSIAPIAGVDKPFIRQWLIWAQNQLGYSSLAHVNSLSPSAELRPIERTQTDEADLMPYDVLKSIEWHAIRNGRSPLETYHFLSQEWDFPKTELKRYITKFYTLWARNQWKRERIAPSFHLDDFNVDPRSWCRFPILSGAYAEELKLLAQKE